MAKHSDETFHLRVRDAGSLEIPADIVRRLGLTPGALAVAAIGLVEAMSIARSIAAQTGQRLDSNQEFVGQGMANVFAGLFSGYPVAGSFSRTAVNFRAGAQTPRLRASAASGSFGLLDDLA